MNQRFSLIPEAYLLLQKGNKILLLRRYQTGYEDGQYSLVAGHIDGDETARNAMMREAREEAGIDLLPENLKLVHVMHRKTNPERIGFFFAATKWNGNIQNKEPEKCDDLHWFEITELPKNTIPYIQKAISAYLAQEAYSEDGWTTPGSA
ncbi:MAG: NUDIX domain-containing protein [Candidatus Peribacteraceae bacterium]|nr:NUDIX domain-containing protein [Candidatus Peribacteraceae bacterium]